MFHALFLVAGLIVSLVAHAQSPDFEAELKLVRFPQFEGCVLVVSNLEGKRIARAPLQYSEREGIRFYEATAAGVTFQMANSNGALLQAGDFLRAFPEFRGYFHESATPSYPVSVTTLTKYPTSGSGGGQSGTIYRNEVHLKSEVINSKSGNLKLGMLSSGCDKSQRLELTNSDAIFAKCDENIKAVISCADMF